MPKNKAMTLRFYDNCLQDMRALRKINEYRKYGCNSSRDLIIKAIENYDNQTALNEVKTEVEAMCATHPITR